MKETIKTSRRVLLNGEPVREAQDTNVFSLFSLTPATDYTVTVESEGETLTANFRTQDESFFVDASRYGLGHSLIISMPFCIIKRIL